MFVQIWINCGIFFIKGTKCFNKVSWHNLIQSIINVIYKTVIDAMLDLLKWPLPQQV